MSKLSWRRYKCRQWINYKKNKQELPKKSKDREQCWKILYRSTRRYKRVNLEKKIVAKFRSPMASSERNLNGCCETITK